jgi:hypothetical protein
MVKTVKNTSKQAENPHVNIRTRYKKITLVLFACILLCLLFAGGYHRLSIGADEKSVGAMRDDVARLVNDIESRANSPRWTDDSFCTVMKPRSFGDITKYSCTALYESRKVVTRQGEINAMIDMHREVLRSNAYTEFDNSSTVEYPQYITNTTILNEPAYKKIKQQSAIGFALKGLKSVDCSIKYELTNAVDKEGVDIISRITCYKNTDKAYFEPVEYL